MTTPPEIMLRMHGNIPYLFDFWANQFFHLLLLKSSFAEQSKICFKGAITSSIFSN